MSDFEKMREELREASGGGWDNVADPIRELKIIRGEPIEWAEAAVAEFTKYRDDFMAKQEFEAAWVARQAMEKFRELLK